MKPEIVNAFVNAVEDTLSVPIQYEGGGAVVLGYIDRDAILGFVRAHLEAQPQPPLAIYDERR